jgi:hypothetical protein
MKKPPEGQATPKACCKKELARSNSKALGFIAASFTQSHVFAGLVGLAEVFVAPLNKRYATC